MNNAATSIPNEFIGIVHKISEGHVGGDGT
jgi:hypothetical protein